MAIRSIAVTAAIAVPGEASHQDAPLDHLVVTGYDTNSGAIGIDYSPACDAVDHTIYYGALESVSSYGYDDATCAVGVTGSATLSPGVADSVFFVIVANDGTEEGSYGRNSVGVQRPEDTGTPTCDRPQNLDGVICE
jgi:hypothetical protein